MDTTKKFEVCDFDLEDEISYAQICFFYKYWNKAEKTRTYSDSGGQLVASDCRLEGRGADGVPLISHLTPEERDNSAAGDNVIMFPRYDIMQKATM